MSLDVDFQNSIARVSLRVVIINGPVLLAFRPPWPAVLTIYLVFASAFL
jgi:hypothetical protein